MRESHARCVRLGRSGNISDCKVVEFNSAVPDIEILWLECTTSNHLF